MIFHTQGPHSGLCSCHFLLQYASFTLYEFISVGANVFKTMDCSTWQQRMHIHKIQLGLFSISSAVRTHEQLWQDEELLADDFLLRKWVLMAHAPIEWCTTVDRTWERAGHPDKLTVASVPAYVHVTATSHAVFLAWSNQRSGLTGLAAKKPVTDHLTMIPKLAMFGSYSTHRCNAVCQIGRKT